MAWSTAVLRERCAAVVATAPVPAAGSPPELDVDSAVAVAAEPRWARSIVALVSAAPDIAIGVLTGAPTPTAGRDGPRPPRVHGPREGTLAVALADTLVTGPPAVRTRKGRWLVRAVDELVLVEQQESWSVQGSAQHLVVRWRCPLAELTAVSGRVELHFGDGSSVRLHPGSWRSRALRRALTSGS